MTAAMIYVPGPDATVKVHHLSTPGAVRAAPVHGVRWGCKTRPTANFFWTGHVIDRYV